MDRSKDWLRDAERNLEQARWSLNGEFYELACFLSQQTAEKAVKALGETNKVEHWGHMISQLLRALSPYVEIPREIMDAAKKLDRQYILPRYPNGFQFGIPADYYTAEDAQEAITRAEKILAFCNRHIPG